MTNAIGDLSTLVAACHTPLIRYLTRFLGCEETAREVAQDAYLRFHAHTSAVAIDHPRAYLFRIARNLALDHLSRNKKANYSSLDEIAETTSPPSVHPEAVFEAEQRWQIMAEALNELPPPCREAFMMNKIQGLTHSQIAEKLGVSKSMVEKHLMRAMSHCRKRLVQSS